MTKALAFGCSLVLWTVASSVAIAQDAILPYREYAKRTDAAQKVSPLTDAAFGANTSLYNGSTSFSVVDIDLPGNSSVPVRLGRTMKVDDRTSGFRPTVGGFAEWEIDIPYIDGTFAWSVGWKVGSGGSTARCSNTQPPTMPGQWNANKVWHGYSMHLPDAGAEMLFVNNKAGVPQPTDGATYPWITKSGYRIKCLSTLASGTGEGFLAVAPDGTKFTFNWMVTKEAPPVRMPEVNELPPGDELRRARVFLLATRVEDRHGNWVTYSYTGDKLTQINSSDSRNITLTWSGDRITSATAAGKTWTYQYATGPMLQRVVLPDGSDWVYSSTGGLAQTETWQLPWEGPTGTCAPFQLPEQVYGYTVKHPAGASTTYTFHGKRHFRTRVNYYCNNPPGTALEELLIPNYADTISLVSRTMVGPGMSSKTWSYDYGHVDNFGFCYQDPFTFEWYCPPPFPCPAGMCPPETDAKYVTVTESTGRKTRYTFGTGFDINEGRMLAEEVLDGTTVKQRTISTFLTDAEAASQPFATAFGTNLVPYQPLAALTRPVRERVITLDGTTFESYTNSYDNFARPTSVRQRTRIAGAVQHTRTELTAYHDRTASWTVGQVKSKEFAGLSPKLFEVTHHATSALPTTITKHGLLVETYTYNANGTLATVKDGLNQTTTLSNWYRGVPRAVGFPDSTGVSATVDGSGNLLSVTNELGDTTSFAYDGGGRVSQVTHPTGDSVVWAPTTISTVPVATAEYGIAAGHWRQTVSTGNARRITYFDGLWRPRLVREYDTANVAGTSRFTVQDYDADGRASFSAYPVASLTSVAGATQGTWTLYDVLGRPTSVSQDSEHGLLTTTTQYLTGFQRRMTNPRGFQTTLSYQTFDQPDTSAPKQILAPANVTTAIARTERGEPTTITRSGTWTGGSQSLSRHYVYDAHRRLCKTIEPETGATVMQYDAAGNLAWSAAGLSLPATGDSACTPARTVAYSSGRRVDRTYDVRNRVTGLVFPDGNGNQTWAYTPDGLPASIITLNNEGSTSVVNSYSYNKRRLMTAESSGIPGWYTWNLGYGYDANGHLASQTYPTGLNVAYAPNALGQPTQAGSYAMGVQYHPSGAVKQFTYGNGLVHTMVQNARQLPARSTDTGGALDHTYAYDPQGNVLSTIDHNDGARSRWMAYDALDRLTDAGSAVFGGDHWHRFTYDALDNLRSWKLAGVKDYANYTYDASNRLTAIQNTGGSTLHSLGYDLQGNLASKDTASYYFDYGNRLRTATGPGGAEGYRYDGHGRRVLAWTPAGSKLSMYSASGQVMFQHSDPQARTFETIYLAGSLVAIKENPFSGASVVKYQHTDALGSPVAMSNQAGAVIERTNFDPYGGAINKTIDGIGYTGHVMDPVTGLTYMQQRYYDPSIGRFLSVDPVTANSATGANFNRYWYANNNPYRFTDPDGREAVCNGSSCYIDCNSMLTCGADYLYVGIVVTQRHLQNAIDSVLANEAAEGPSEEGDSPSEEGTRELGDLEPIHAPDHPQNNPEIGNLTDDELGGAINNPADGEKVKVRGNRVLDGNTRINEARARGWPSDTLIPVEELPDLPDNVDEDPLGPYREL
ncbi:RHS repeat domain-containing protein [Arenimonas alkanexedens]